MTLEQSREQARAKGTLELVRRIAQSHQLSAPLVLAIVEQESAFDECAIRPESESGFVARYGAEYQRLVKASASRRDDKWIRFEDVFYCSYGLMQTMYCVIIETFPEAADQLIYPTRLCSPQVGVDYGCRLLKRKMAGANQDQRLALLRWNGGGDKQYPDKVFNRMTAFA